jgi:ATP-binding cassette subfamily B protein
VGLLLGWHKAAEGRCVVDERELTGDYLRDLRNAIAWVDPAVQLWNRSLLENLNYGNPPENTHVQTAIEEADLFDVLSRFDNGLHTPLGESGGLVSGGEGQRVRLGRALLRPNTRLVVLDEPFRGLDRDKRRLLLQRARAHWRAQTLLCVTHDVGETQTFERVLVVENGRIIEDDAPARLAANPQSRYRALLDAEETLRTGLWQNTTWRRLHIENGRLTERRP